MSLKVNFQIEKGQTYAIMGPSGAGKTSLLRCIAGLMPFVNGRIRFDGQEWYNGEEGLQTPTRHRRLGFVFQDFALFDHMTARENLMYAQRGGDEKTVNDLLDQVALLGLSETKPAVLSGGQKQRLSIARALISEPELLLIDEGLSAQDEEMRGHLRDVIQNHTKTTTTLLVTHNTDDIRHLADGVLLMEGGRIKHEGTLETVRLATQLHVVLTEHQVQDQTAMVQLAGQPLKVFTTDQGPYEVGHTYRLYKEGDKLMI